MIKLKKDYFINGTLNAFKLIQSSLRQIFMKSILVLDDDVRICDELAEFLSHRNYQVHTAGKPSLARELLHMEAIELVFLDINLPEMNGINFLKEIKREFPGINVIIITGISSRLLEENARESGAVNYLRKPIQFSQIEEAIKQINKPYRRES